MKRASVVVFILVAMCLVAISGIHAVPGGKDLAPQVKEHLVEAAALGLYHAPSRPLSGPGLERLQIQDPTQEIKLWVFLTDKGIGTPSRFQTSLEQVQANWNQDTRERRALLREAGNVDFTDIPVYAPYVNQLKDSGIQVHRQSRWLNAVSVRIPASKISMLGSFAFVRFVQPVLVSSKDFDSVPMDDKESIGLATQPDSLTEANFYGPSYVQLDQIQVLDLHRLGYTGAGVKVMVLDTGFKSSHPAFNTCTDLADQYDFVQEDGNTENEAGDVFSQHNHGTGVWATLGGYAPGDLIGPSWGATFYLAKTEDLPSETTAEEDNYVAALEWADTLGVDITSASLAYLGFDGGGGYTYADLDGNTAVITIAIDLAVGKGITCLNAMGNSGPGAGSLWTPADADSIISCGAVSSLGTVAGFSGRGPTADARIKPELCAMGVSTRWAVASTDGYGSANGTSLSTPLLGGLAALIKEARPSWTGMQIRDALMQTGTNMATPDNDLGWGIAQGLDAANFGGGALSPPRMTLPFALCDPQDEEVVVTDTPKLVWGTSVAMQPGDGAIYSVHYKLGVLGSELTAPAGMDTCWTVPGATLAPGDTLFWWVSAVGDSGYVRKSMDQRSLVVNSQLAVGDDLLPGAWMGAPSPNPFHGTTNISWRMDVGESMRVDVLDIQGRMVRHFEVEGSGSWGTITWDGKSNLGNRVSPGMYWVRAISPQGAQTRKVIKLP